MKLCVARPCDAAIDMTASLRASVTSSILFQRASRALRLAKAVNPSSITSITIPPSPTCSRVSIFMCFSMVFPPDGAGR
ncbi:hypothetical protein D3C86_2112040 [compost metagenome]